MERHPQTRQFAVALEIATLHRDWELVSRVAVFRIVLERGTQQNALGFESDIQIDRFGVNGDDNALQLAGTSFNFVRTAALKLCEQFAEGFRGGFRLGFDWRERIRDDFV